MSEKKLDNQGGLSVQLKYPSYPQYLIENGGHLPKLVEAMACWHYFVMASSNVEEQKTGVLLEGDLDPKYNFSQLYKTVSFWYGVEREAMDRMWPAVDKQARALGLKLLPHHLKFTGIIIN